MITSRSMGTPFAPLLEIVVRFGGYYVSKRIPIVKTKIGRNYVRFKFEWALPSIVGERGAPARWKVHHFIVLGKQQTERQPARLHASVGGRVRYVVGACSGRRKAKPSFDEEQRDTLALHKVLKGVEVEAATTLPVLCDTAWHDLTQTTTAKMIRYEGKYREDSLVHGFERNIQGLRRNVPMPVLGLIRQHPTNQSREKTESGKTIVSVTAIL